LKDLVQGGTFKDLVGAAGATLAGALPMVELYTWRGVVGRIPTADRQYKTRLYFADGILKVGGGGVLLDGHIGSAHFCLISPQALLAWVLDSVCCRAKL
jgi:hypothetical protein